MQLLLKMYMYTNIINIQLKSLKNELNLYELQAFGRIFR